MIVDVVTERSGNLHRALLELLGVSVTTAGQAEDEHAAAYAHDQHRRNLEPGGVGGDTHRR